MVKKVYVVEDDPKNMKLFRVILTRLPEIEIFEATEGDKGLKLIKSGEPDLIILDIKLPSMSGIEICRELRRIERFQTIPIFAVTAYAMNGDEERILEAGFNEYIAKPINIAQFKSKIRQYLTN